MAKSFQIGRKIFEPTHKLKVAVGCRPAGTLVHLLGQRKEVDGWHVLVVCPVLSKEAQSYSFSTKWENLARA